MRQYLRVGNLLRAFGFACVLTLMSIPRIRQGELPMEIYLPAALISMTLVSGAATAWSSLGGFVGVLPPRRHLLVGMLAGLALALLFLPAYLYVTPVVKESLLRANRLRLLHINYPRELSGKLALVLWSAGFHTMFFHAAPMALFVRLTHRAWTAVTLTIALRVMVMIYRFARLEITGDTFTVLLLSGVAATTACVLYARGGFPAAALFSAGLNLHLFVSD